MKSKVKVQSQSGNRPVRSAHKTECHGAALPFCSSGRTLTRHSKTGHNSETPEREIGTLDRESDSGSRVLYNVTWLTRLLGKTEEVALTSSLPTPPSLSQTFGNAHRIIRILEINQSKMKTNRRMNRLYMQSSVLTFSDSDRMTVPTRSLLVTIEIGIGAHFTCSKEEIGSISGLRLFYLKRVKNL